MGVHTSLVSSVLSVGILVVITFILWNRIQLISRSLKLPESERNSVGRVSGIFLFGWLLISLALAVLDFYHVTPQFISPLVPLGFALPVIIGLHLMQNSSTFQKVLDALPQELLILLQVPRIGGVVFLLLYMQGVLPALFAIPSGVGDLIVGLSAPIVWYYYSKNGAWSRNLAIAWNAVGILDLAIAIITGVLLAVPPQYSIISSTPSTEPMTLFPLVLIPVFAVPLGLLMHVFSLRLLLKRT